MRRPQASSIETLELRTPEAPSLALTSIAMSLSPRDLSARH
ncbi:hypothetical protein CBM2587_A70053 [Cupriavidus taiwanensis]|uniref:Uncharacterized protein n=1 Tax=Cupriavidus taiwanensis TaxID=164546 RepID=A0A976A2Y6_9BURK|nr:hypothetical protein CBM2587_A70053 [Cupriavidus taiwanensis]